LYPLFAEAFQLGDELGSGGYGFVMTAHHRATGCEVAVKFIVKETVPVHAWMENEDVGRLPAEIMLLSLVKHDNIVQLLDVYEDELYYYMVSLLALHNARQKRSNKTIDSRTSRFPVASFVLDDGPTR
jgi:serine/threonine protein kinase